MDNKYLLYRFFNSPIALLVRVCIFFILAILVYLNKADLGFVRMLVPVYFFSIVQELFIFFHLNRIAPLSTVLDAKDNILDSMAFKARLNFENYKTTAKLMDRLSSEAEVKYFIRQSGAVIPKEFPEMDRKTLLSDAVALTLSVGGVYITNLDLYTAFLLDLFKNKDFSRHQDTKLEDIVALYSWVRKEYEVDKKHKADVAFTGSGAFDFFVFGWSSELARYALNFTQESLSGYLIKPVGRENEYSQLVTALSKRSSSNALLIGEAGVGKTEILRLFAVDSYSSRLPVLSHKTVFKLLVEQVLAGVSNPGDLESRFSSLLDELLHTGNIVVYIPNIENIFGGGGFNTDISGVLIEYLKSNRIKIIGTTTPAAFQTYIYPKQAVRELFDQIQIEEADSKTAIFMLLEKKKELEMTYKISITYDAVKEAVMLSSSYVPDGFLPGRAVALLEEALSRAGINNLKTITKHEVRSIVEQKTHILLESPTNEEKQKLLHLEEEMHKHIISQDEAVSAIAGAMRRVRSGVKDTVKPIASFLFLGPTGVGKTETAKVLKNVYFGEESNMVRVDMSEYQTQESIVRFLGSYDGTNVSESVVDKILENPFSLILLDEFEKAHPHILDLFLQVLDEGHITDNRGRTISFINTIIIATSNAGSEFIREKSMVAKKALIDEILKQNVFKPELVNRFDDVIVFKPLSVDEMKQISRLFLEKLAKTLEDQNIEIKFDKSIEDMVAENSFSQEFGGRNLEHYIQDNIENPLSQKILEGSIVGGDRIIVTYGVNGLEFGK